MKPRKTPRWPHPADTPLDRSRAIARQLLGELERLMPQRAAQLVDASAALGETWLRPVTAYETPKEIVSAHEIARRFAVSLHTVYSWHRRGKITRYPGGFDPVQVATYLDERRKPKTASTELGESA